GPKYHRFRPARRDVPGRGVFYLHLLAQTPGLSPVLGRGLGLLRTQLPLPCPFSVDRHKLASVLAELRIVWARRNLFPPWNAALHPFDTLARPLHWHCRLRRSVVGGKRVPALRPPLDYSFSGDLHHRRPVLLAREPPSRNHGRPASEPRLPRLGTHWSRFYVSSDGSRSFLARHLAHFRHSDRVRFHASGNGHLRRGKATGRAQYARSVQSQPGYLGLHWRRNSAHAGPGARSRAGSGSPSLGGHVPPSWRSKRPYFRRFRGSS